MTIERIPAEDREEGLQRLTGWIYEPKRDAIVRTFKFRDFVEAFSFMTRVALFAEKADHHPEWSNVYNSVEILLVTHDANGLSERDFQLAERIDATASR